MLDRDERLGSLAPGQAIAVQTTDGDRVEGVFVSLNGDCLILDMGVYDRLVLAEEVERVVAGADPPGP
jgi:hypothetical protein